MVMREKINMDPMPGTVFQTISACILGAIMLPTAKHTDSFVLCSLCSEENVKKGNIDALNLKRSGLLQVGIMQHYSYQFYSLEEREPKGYVSFTSLL